MRRTRRPDARPIVRVTRDGREICNRNSGLGRIEYKVRIIAMVRRQKGFCCLDGIAPMCPGRLSEAEATFEHEDGRGMGGGKRDDRIVLPNGQWQNGAAHNACNSWKGSRRIEYNAKPEEK